MIFYFTGSGNGKFIAETIASKTNDRIINITDCIQHEQFVFTLGPGEALGFVAPVYFMGIPLIVLEFLKKLKISSEPDAYSYLVLHCGGTTADAEGEFSRTYPVKAIFGVVAVDNYVPIYKIENRESIDACLNKMEQELETVLRHIQAKDAGSFNTLRKRLPRLYTFVGTLIFKNGRKTGKFTVNQNCTGCGLCQKICPRKAIALQDKKPRWVKPQCELCFGCLHRCPVEAINYGGQTAAHGRYVNPRTRL